jgi:hypothetical protein
MFNVCDCCAEAGLMVTLAGGSTVKSAEFELAKAVPVEVVPAIETLKDVGELTESPGGIENKTRSVVPATTDTLVAVVIALGVVPPEGVNETVTLGPGILPAGKFEPITVIDDTPGWPEEGVANGVKLTCVTCATAAPAANSVHARRIAQRIRDCVREFNLRRHLALGRIWPPNLNERREIPIPTTHELIQPGVAPGIVTIFV